MPFRRPEQKRLLRQVGRVRFLAAERKRKAISNRRKEQTDNARKPEELDRILYGSERLLTRKEGLPRRDWFKHQIYAPGFYTGYGVKTLPGIREAIEQRNWQEATEQVEIAARTIERFAAEIDRAAQFYVWLP